MTQPIVVFHNGNTLPTTQQNKTKHTLSAATLQSSASVYHSRAFQHFAD